MKTSKADVIAAGKWLTEQRALRGERCSGRLVATFATLLANRQGDPIKIHQQQISAIENADEDSGPAKVPNWWRYVRALFETGEIDSILEASSPKPSPAEDAGDELFIQTAAGERVGRIVWLKPLQ